MLSDHAVERVFGPRDGSPLAAFPALVGFGPVWFSSQVRGSDLLGESPPEQQCVAVYDALLERLSRVGLDSSSVVRLDHHVSSQSWLPARQAIRARYFGRPAPLASSGIAMTCEPGNHLSAALMATRAGAPREVLVDGAAFGMPAISSAVRAGDLVFVSGILKHASAPPQQETPYRESPRYHTAAALAAGVLADFRAILNRSGHSLRPLRCDIFARDSEDARELLRLMHGQWQWREPTPLCTVIHTPFDGRRAIEATLIAHPAESEAPFEFLQASSPSGDSRLAMDNALQALERALHHRNIDQASVCRLDLTIADGLLPADDALDLLARHWSDERPAVSLRRSSKSEQPIANKSITIDAIVARRNRAGQRP